MRIMNIDNSMVSRGASDYLTRAELTAPIIVCCGVCRENINEEDARFMPIGKTGGWNYCCRECQPCWQEMEQYIKPVKVIAHVE